MTRVRRYLLPEYRLGDHRVTQQIPTQKAVKASDHPAGYTELTLSILQVVSVMS